MRLTPFLMAIFILELIGIAFIFYINPKHALVSFDADKVKGEFIRQLASHHLSDKDIFLKTKSFNQHFKKVLKEYALNNKAIILDKKEVWAGSIDITDKIMDEISLAMRHKR